MTDAAHSLTRRETPDAPILGRRSEGRIGKSFVGLEGPRPPLQDTSRTNLFKTGSGMGRTSDSSSVPAFGTRLFRDRRFSFGVSFEHSPKGYLTSVSGYAPRRADETFAGDSGILENLYRNTGTACRTRKTPRFSEKLSEHDMTSHPGLVGRKRNSVV
jgi:hypothetical protein